MAHTHVICDQGYDILRCRCPGPITFVKPCFPDHFHGPLRWEAKVGHPVLIEDTRNRDLFMPDPDTIRGVLESIYGSGDMVIALAENIAKRWDDWDADDRRDLPTNLQLYIWDWFAGGDTAQLAADRIIEVIGKSD